MSDDLSPTDMRRLWTPWRMKYVRGGTVEDGCIFCNRLAAADDATSLILHRGERAFIIMNLFPYNTGHVMIAPTAHVSTPEELEPEALVEVATLLQPIFRALRRVLNPVGFNVGLNVGEVAGAGVVAHLHVHVVPRWTGDANFMPILASTMVMPEMIQVTYAKLRAELHREMQPVIPDQPIALVVLANAGEWVLVQKSTAGGRLPVVPLRPDIAVWQAAIELLAGSGVDASLVGWAGSGRIGEHPPALAFESLSLSTPSRGDMAWISADRILDELPAMDARLVADARQRLVPTVIAPPG